MMPQIALEYQGCDLDCRARPLQAMLARVHWAHFSHGDIRNTESLQRTLRLMEEIYEDYETPRMIRGRIANLN